MYSNDFHSSGGNKSSLKSNLKSKKKINLNKINQVILSPNNNKPPNNKPPNNKPPNNKPPNNKPPNNKPNNNKPIERNIHVNKDKLFEKIGILDPDGNNINPLTGNPYENIYIDAAKYPNTYQGYSKMWTALPMHDIRNEVIQSIYDNQIVLIISGTGSGKTVLAPKLALHAMNYQGRILITNPKQLPSKENADFAAKTLDVPLGQQVGYKYRGSPEGSSSKNTNLLYCTDGYVLARLKTDPYLKDYDALIIDEAHERNIRIDLLLLETKELIQRRPDFKLIIMSATINAQIFIDYFPKKEYKFGLIEADGKSHFHVESIFLPKGGEVNKFDKNGVLVNKLWIDKMVDIIFKIIVESESGDILAFITGKGEISDVCMKIKNKLKEHNNSNKHKIFCTPLSGQSSDEEKSFAVNSESYKTKNNGYNRKLVVATEVAESSITIDGLMYIVDAGLSNQLRYYPETNINALEKRYISKASHKQRCGRTGRTAPGKCYNVFTEKEYNDLFLDYSIAPIKLDNIIGEILNFMNKTDLVSHVDLPFKYSKKPSEKYPMSLNDYLLRLIEAPYEETVSESLKRLIALGALTVNENKAYLNNIGIGMNKFDSIPMEMSRALLSSYDYNCSYELCNVAALIELSDGNFDSLFIKYKADKRMNTTQQKIEKNNHTKILAKLSSSYGDLVSFLKIYKYFENIRYNGKNNRQSNQESNEQSNEAHRQELEALKEWCRKNYIKYGILDRIKRFSKEYHSKLMRHVNNIKRNKQNQPNNQQNNQPHKQFSLVYPNKPILDTNIYNNVLSALNDGYYVNLLRNNGYKKYITCFPKTKTMSVIDDDNSLYINLKSLSKYLFYIGYASYGGRATYRIMTPISPDEITRIKNNNFKNMFVDSCLSDTSFNKIIKEKFTKNNSSPQKQHKHQHKHKKHKKK